MVEISGGRVVTIGGGTSGEIMLTLKKLKHSHAMKSWH